MKHQSFVGTGYFDAVQTIVTNGNQNATGGEAVHVCTDDEIANDRARARTYLFQREFTDDDRLRRIDNDAILGRQPPKENL